MPRPNIEQLRDIGLFGGLNDAALEAVTEDIESIDLVPGTVVMREGEHAREMFVVLSGELEVLRRSRGGAEGRVALLGPGSWFGEMSILDTQPRSATVQSVAQARVLKLSAEHLDRLYRRDQKAYLMVVLNIARELSRRLRVADGMISGFLDAIYDQNLGFSRPPR
ncbi:MAG: cyclic nucleotide-binding domain-containing protein [Myxococcales bacterium]|nr:cyclic nucleotide-binding domain-containing protein [Myxococcales bacterium]